MQSHSCSRKGLADESLVDFLKPLFILWVNYCFFLSEAKVTRQCITPTIRDTPVSTADSVSLPSTHPPWERTKC